MVAWLSTSGAAGQGLRGGEGRVFPHVVGAALDPDLLWMMRSMCDGVGVDAGAETLVHMAEGAFQVVLNHAGSGAEPCESGI